LLYSIDSNKKILMNISTIPKNVIKMLFYTTFKLIFMTYFDATVC